MTNETLLSINDEVEAVLNDLNVLTKLEEMDDFMNQNDLKVNITNENAVTTGLVTYTCTVKDQDNTALPNRVVEWYKGTTLLGLDATDSNGISTFSHRVTEADIYDVHAIVRGTHAGDDIRMFVKDKDNVLTFNQWSCGDYNKDLTGFTRNQNNPAGITTECSVNGDRCIKMTKTASSSGTNTVTCSYDIASDDWGKTATVTASAFKNINKDSAITLLAYTPNSTQLEYLYISTTGDFASHSISHTIPDDTTKLEIKLSMATNNETTYLFVDNLKLTIQ